MKRFLLAANLAAGAALMAASPAMADITCWYDDAGNSTGGDNADPRYPRGKVVKTGNGGDYAWAYTINAENAMSCPKKRPAG